jgi:hypothetical protein
MGPSLRDRDKGRFRAISFPTFRSKRGRQQLAQAGSYDGMVINDEYLHFVNVPRAAQRTTHRAKLLIFMQAFSSTKVLDR